MKKQIPFSLLFFLCLLTGVTTMAQTTTSPEEVAKDERIRKNTIRLNVTNPIIFGDRALILGYERTIGEHQSFSINVGQANLPKFNLVSIADDSLIQLTKSSKDRGYNLTGDYRFYLASENKHRAPRGVYIGPYVSHVFMGRENKWNLNTVNGFQGEVISDFTFNMTAIGAQLGYQFVIWKRLALDFVLIGPSVAWYSLEAKLDTSLDPDDESSLYAKIDEILRERFPGYSFVLDDIDFKTSGSTNTQSFGFRYTIHLGYRF